MIDKQFAFLFVIIIVVTLLTIINKFDTETTKTIVIAMFTYVIGLNQDNKKVIK